MHFYIRKISVSCGVYGTMEMVKILNYFNGCILKSLYFKLNKIKCDIYIYIYLYVCVSDLIIKLLKMCVQHGIVFFSE